MLAHDIAERHVRDPLAVRDAASGVSDRFGRFGTEPLPELMDQRRLPDSRVAHDRHEVRPPFFNSAAVGTLQRLELSLAADEGRGQATNAARPNMRQRADEPATDDSADLSFGYDRHGLVELERATHRRSRAFPDEDLTGLGGLLEPGRNIDCVARDEGAAHARLPHDNVSGVHADAQRERAAAELL